MSKDSLTAFSYASCIFCFAASAAPAAAFTIAFCACWKEFRNFYKKTGKSKNYCTWPSFIHLFYSIVYGNNEEEQEQFSIQNKYFLY